MDWHEIAMGAITLVMTILGWGLVRLFAKMDELEDDMQNFRSGIYQKYVQRDDYRADIAELKAMLGKIFDKLDEKMDKA
jgi:uncharacterized coiled-coil DUF342 family protein